MGELRRGNTSATKTRRVLPGRIATFKIRDSEIRRRVSDHGDGKVQKFRMREAASPSSASPDASGSGRHINDVSVAVFGRSMTRCS